MPEHSTTALRIIQDSGAPPGKTKYTTLVLLHGYAWQSGIFAKLIPLAHSHHARVVLVNRREYPGSIPYTPAERAVLQTAMHDVHSGDLAAARSSLLHFMAERACELHTLLVRFVTENEIPPADHGEGAGGMVVGGWSFGTAWMTALLANAATFPVDRVDLGRYVRRVILFDSPYGTLGYPSPSEDPYAPLSDPSLAPENTTRVFAEWVSGYYTHGDTSDKLERRTALVSPPSTLSTLTAEERASTMYLEPGNPGNPDALLLTAGTMCGLFAALREGAFHLAADTGAETFNAWSAVGVRYVWCDQSVWVIPWCLWNMRAEFKEAKRAGKPVRNLSFLRLRGANHFVHWDEPQRALEALLAESAESID